MSPSRSSTSAPGSSPCPGRTDRAGDSSSPTAPSPCCGPSVRATPAAGGHRGHHGTPARTRPRVSGSGPVEGQVPRIVSFGGLGTYFNLHLVPTTSSSPDRGRSGPRCSAAPVDIALPPTDVAGDVVAALDRATTDRRRPSPTAEPGPHRPRAAPATVRARLATPRRRPSPAVVAEGAAHSSGMRVATC